MENTNGHWICQNNPLDDHVRNAMPERCRYIKKPTNMPSWRAKAALVMIWNDLPHGFIDKVIVSSSHTRLWSCVAAAGALSEHSLNTEWLSDMRETLELSTKAVQRMIRSWLISLRCYKFTRENWTLKFKLLHLLHHISYFDEICRIRCVHTVWEFGSNSQYRCWELLLRSCF